MRHNHGHSDNARLSGVDQRHGVRRDVDLSRGGPAAGPQFVVAFDPSTSTEMARTTLDLPLENITADEQNVVAFADNKIYVLSASDLALQRVINIDNSLIQTHADAMFILNGDVLVADDELGAGIPNRILLFHDWRPPPAPAPTPKLRMGEFRTKHRRSTAAENQHRGEPYVGADGRTRTGTGVSSRGILSFFSGQALSPCPLGQSLDLRFSPLK